MKRSIYESLSRRVGWAETRLITSVSALVDPNFKDSNFIGGPNIIKQAKEMLKKEIQKANNIEEEDENKASERVEPVEAEPPKKKFAIWDSINKKIQQHDVRLEKNQTKHMPDAIDVEMKEYFSTKTVQVEEPLAWWYDVGQHSYPKMYKVAMNILVIQATSVPSERVFSDAGRVYDNKRTKLGVEAADMMVCLHKNLDKSFIP